MKILFTLLLLCFAATSYGAVNINWGASAGFYFNANPSVGILGDGTGHSTVAQLMYSPDGIRDSLSSATLQGVENDVIWATVAITEDGITGNLDDYACFAETYIGTFTAGYVYAVIFQDDNYGGSDWYYYTPMLPLTDITGAMFPQTLEMNTDLVNGNAIDFGPNTVQRFYIPSYTLTINNGTGSGSYHGGDTAEISADAPATGKAFSQWIGDTQYVASVSSADTTVDMPEQDVTLTATYTDVYYTLTVNCGTGDGSYTNGTQVAIEADAPPVWKVFDRWIGDTQYVAGVTSASTTVTMPDGNITLTATFKAGGGGLVYPTTNVTITFPADQYVPFTYAYEPVSTNGNTIDTLFAGLPIGSEVSLWDNTSQSWNSFPKTRSGWGSYGTNRLIRGAGVLVKSPAATNLVFSGALPWDETTALDTDGSISYPYPVDIAFTNTEISKVASSIYVWTNGGTGWVPYPRVVPYGEWPPEVKNLILKNCNNMIICQPAGLIINEPRPYPSWLPPIGWMDQYGLTNYFTEVDADQDGDGLAAWQEYIAGTNPTNPASGFCVTETARNVLSWSAVSGRVYSVYWTTNLLSGFQCLESNIPWTSNSYTDTVHNAAGQLFYRIEVQLEE